MHRSRLGRFKSSPPWKSTWVQTCALLQPPLHLIFSNYNLLEQLLADASLPPPSWVVYRFYESCWACEAAQPSKKRKKKKTCTREENIWGISGKKKGKGNLNTGRGQMSCWWLPSVTWICKGLHGCSVSVWRGCFRALSHALTLNRGHTFVDYIKIITVSFTVPFFWIAGQWPPSDLNTFTTFMMWLFKVKWLKWWIPATRKAFLIQPPSS